MSKNNIGFDSRKIKEKNIQEQNKYSKKRKKFWYTILIIFLFLMFALGVGSYILIKYLANKVEDSTEERLSTISNSDWQNEWQKITRGTENDNTENQQLEEENGKEGDILSDGNVSISLSIVEHREEIGKEKPREGYEFLVLRMNIMNQTMEETYFYSTNFILRDSRYTEYNMKTINTDEYNLIKGVQNIPSEGWIDGQVIYEVQKEVGKLEFLYMGEKKLIFEIEPN